MHTVAGAVDILAQGPFQAEDAIETIRLERFIDRQGELESALGTTSADRNSIQRDASAVVGPGFRKKVDVVAGVAQGTQEPLEIEFRAARARESAADQRQLHARHLR
jgi:hypothetical protein